VEHTVHVNGRNLIHFAICSYLGLERDSSLINAAKKLHPKLCLISSLGKGFGAYGAVMVFPEEQQKQIIKFTGSSLIFSGPVYPAVLGAAIASADIHLSPEIYTKQAQQKKRMTYF
jgi:7-keto-8-aminopelargonate synthetase-like enzyme